MVDHSRCEPLPDGSSDVWAGVDLVHEGFVVDAVTAAGAVCIEPRARGVLDDVA